jgi:hypothetical protein
MTFRVDKHFDLRYFFWKRMNFLIHELKKRGMEKCSTDFRQQWNARTATWKVALALLSWLSIKNLRHCFQITRTHMSSLMHFFAKDNCHFHSFDHSLELCLAAKISNHKRAKFLKTQHFLNFQWFKCTTRFTFSALILVSLQKALT